MAKNYYWLKIQDNFFRQKEIKILRQMERGAVYIIIYQKMMIYSLKNGNKLFYDNLKDSFEEELALLIDEDVEDVKATLDFLKRARLVYCINDDEYELSQVDELTGSESESTKRVRKHREKKKLAETSSMENESNEDNHSKDEYNLDNTSQDKNSSQDKSKTKNYSKLENQSNKNTKNMKENQLNKNTKHRKEDQRGDNVENNAEAENNNIVVTCETFCNENVTTDIEKELDKEKELNTETDKKINKKQSQNKNIKSTKRNSSTKSSEEKSVDGCVSEFMDENLSQISKLYEQNIGPIYPANTQYFIEVSEKIHWTLFKKAVEICIDKSNVTPAYLKGIIKKWINQNIYTLEDLKAKEIEILNKNSQYKNNHGRSKEKDYNQNINNEHNQNSNKGSKGNIFLVGNNKENNDYMDTSCEAEEIDENMLREMKALEEKLGVS